MRIVIDIMIGLMVVSTIAGGVYLYTSRAQEETQVQAVRTALVQLEKQADYNRTVQSAMAGRDVLLVHIHEQWFGEDVPANVLLDSDRPWIDLAPPGDLGEHPPDPVASKESQAGFWYNPTTGVFRARVLPAASEAQTLALYNQINGTALPGFEQIPDSSRQPLAHVPGTTPAKQYASMANKTWSEPVAEDSLATDLIEGPISTNPEVLISESAPQVSPDIDEIARDQASPPNVQEPADIPIEVVSEQVKRPTLKNTTSN